MRLIMSTFEDIVHFFKLIFCEIIYAVGQISSLYAGYRIISFFRSPDNPDPESLVNIFGRVQLAAICRDLSGLPPHVIADCVEEMRQVIANARREFEAKRDLKRNVEPAVE